MNSEKALIFTAGVVLGIIVGLVMPKIFSGGKGVAPPPPPPLASQDIDYQERIDRLQVVLKNDPGNYEAWVQLGNTYFDSNKPSDAVDAYTKALEIDPSSPDVHTDLGIMYRRLKRSEDAVAQFRRAMELDPRHFNSRQNLGIVLLHDMNDLESAIAAWEELLEIEPAGQRADRVRAQIETLREAQRAGETQAPAQGVEPGLPALPPGMGGMPFPPPVDEGEGQ